MTSLVLLTTPFLIQVRMPLALLATCAHCWLIQLTVHQYTKASFCQAAFQPLLLKRVGLPGVVVTKMQDLELGPIEAHTV